MNALKKLAKQRSTALIVVDQQIDFQPGGALPVPEGDQITGGIAELMPFFSTVVCTQDSHPPQHISFASSYEGKKPYQILTLADLRQGLIQSPYFSKSELENYLTKTAGHSQVLWPDHCIVGTKGWDFDSNLPLSKAHLIVKKGMRRDCDSYSGFFENDGTTTGLGGYLRDRGVERVIVVGLAGDYCVAWTAKDAQKLGFQVGFARELTRFVNQPKGSAEAALKDLSHNGIEIIDA